MKYDHEQTVTIAEEEQKPHQFLRSAVKRLVIFVKKWRMLIAFFVCATVWMPAYFIGAAVENKTWLPLYMFWAGMAYKSFLTWSAR